MSDYSPYIWLYYILYMKQLYWGAEISVSLNSDVYLQALQNYIKYW